MTSIRLIKGLKLELPYCITRDIHTHTQKIKVLEIKKIEM